MTKDRSHADKAVEYFNHNYNCAQSIFACYAAEFGIDERLALKLGTNSVMTCQKRKTCSGSEKKICFEQPVRRWSEVRLLSWTICYDNCYYKLENTEDYFGFLL